MAAPTPYGSRLDYSSKTHSREPTLLYSRKLKAVETIDDSNPLEAQAPAPLLDNAVMQQLTFIGHALQRVFLLSALAPQQHQACLQQMTKRTYQAGDIVVEQVCAPFVWPARPSLVLAVVYRMAATHSKKHL
jgi:hypothetical protein